MIVVIDNGNCHKIWECFSRLPMLRLPKSEDSRLPV